jgi:nitric oxide reductase subunit C
MIYRRIAFFTIVILALVYTYMVYTAGTNNQDGELLSAKAADGKLLWQHYNCQACHQLYGLGGYMGPDLTNEIKLKGREYPKFFITQGTAKMPNLHLNPSETDAIVEFLGCVSNSGEYPISQPKTTLWGGLNIIKKASKK